MSLSLYLKQNIIKYLYNNTSNYHNDVCLFCKVLTNQNGRFIGQDMTSHDNVLLASTKSRD